jgi:uncharacterized protein YbbC (DUF1343 family)
MVLTGLDVLLADPAMLRGKRVGLITNPTAYTRDLRASMVDAIARVPGCTIGALFGPEHGVRGDLQDGIHGADEVDAPTGAPVFSLYGKYRKPTQEMLAGLDLLIYDMQDVGNRHYTYLYTLAYCMQAAKQAGIPMMVLDRPNPINGLDIEGPRVDPANLSFVGMYPVPTRYGLTIGEFARYLVATDTSAACELHVVGMRGWQRHMFFDDTGLPWITPSPNLPTLDCSVLYAATCLIEGTNLSEGRGTTHPFDWIGAPWVDASALALRLNTLALPGVAFRPVYFEPRMSKHTGVRCAGVETHVTNRITFKPFATGLHILTALIAQHPEQFKFLPTSWEASPPHFDLLVGDSRIRPALLAGTPVREMLTWWADSERDWRTERKAYLRY